MDKYQEFFNKVKSDKGLQEKIKAVKTAAKDEMAAGVVKVAKEAGYDLDPQQLQKSFFEMKGELSDQDLETVAAAGGGRGDCGSGGAPLY